MYHLIKTLGYFLGKITCLGAIVSEWDGDGIGCNQTKALANCAIDTFWEIDRKRSH